MLNTLIKHDLKALQAFVAIVECQGISAAQERLKMSQSAISNHLAHLEESLGVTLCQRGRSGFALTKAGHQLYDACTHLLQATSEFHRHVQNIKWNRSVLSGTLRIGIVAQLPHSFHQTLSAAIQTAYQHYPELRIAIDVKSEPDIEYAIANNQMDLGIGSYHHHMKNLRYQPIIDDRYNLYCHVHHPAAQVDQLSLVKLVENYVWVENQHTPIPLGIGLRGGITTATAFQTEAVLLFILAGTHIGFLPQEMTTHYVNQGILIPLLPQQATFLSTQYAVTRPTPDPRVNWFLGQIISLIG